MGEVAAAPTPQEMTKVDKELVPYHVIGKTATQEYAVNDADAALRAVLDFAAYHSAVWGGSVELKSGEKGKAGAVYTGKHHVLPNVMTNWANLLRKDETSVAWMEEDCTMKIASVKDTDSYKMVKIAFDFGYEAMANNAMTGVKNFPKWMKFEIVPYKDAYKLTVTQKKRGAETVKPCVLLAQHVPMPSAYRM